MHRELRAAPNHLVAIQTLFAPRASTLLHELLQTRATPGTFLLPANIRPIVTIASFKAGGQIEFVDVAGASLAMDLDWPFNAVYRGTRRF